VAHNCLARLIRYSKARDLVRRNVSALVGQRPPLVGPSGGQRPRIQRRVQRSQLLLVQSASRRLPTGRHPGQPGRPAATAALTAH
jgi:hypothetical protein